MDLSSLGARLDIATIELAELQSRFEPVAVTDNAIVVQLAAPFNPALEGSPSTPSFGEIGSTGQSIWTGMLREDYNPVLRGRQGLLLYDQMRKGDGQVRGTLRLVKTPVLAGRWYIKPASDAKRDVKIADQIWDNLTKWMTMSWPQFLTETLLMLDYGFYAFEKVFDERDGKIIWRKFAARHPLDVYRWDFDNHGGPKGIEFMSHDPFGGIQPVYIPIHKLAVFTFDKEAGDMTGVSVLRSAYKHWFFKENFYKIDAIQKERHGVGIPVIQLPPNFNDKDMKLADEMGRNLRSNEKAHIVLPGPLWNIFMLKLEGNTVDAIASATHHNEMIAANILAPFLANQSGAQEKSEELFIKATRYVADIIRDVLNKHCIPQLVNWNYPNVAEYPELMVRRIGDTRDWRTFSFALRNFIGAGVIIPDDPLEDWVRDELDLPAADDSTARNILAPPQQPGTAPAGAGGDKVDTNPGKGGPGAGMDHQNEGVGSGPPRPPSAGLPRQSTAAGMGTGKSGAAGSDKSGGK